MYKQLAISN